MAKKDNLKQYGSNWEANVDITDTLTQAVFLGELSELLYKWRYANCGDGDADTDCVKCLLGEKREELKNESICEYLARLSTVFV